MNSHDRRTFLKKSSLASLILIIGQSCKQTSDKNSTILVISGWQDVNIGDIAHTPGLLHILETFIPESNLMVHGTPAFYLRQPEDTIKGQMYYDLGLEDWVFEIEEIDGKDISTEPNNIWQDPVNAKNAVQRSNQNINEIYARNCRRLEQLV